MAGPAPGLTEVSCGDSPSKPCQGNTADDRLSWYKCDITMDPEEYIPTTGNVREYWFDINETVWAPDGHPRSVTLVNGQLPGPTIFADWGDWVKIHVHSNLTAWKYGTGIHWHGINQWYTNGNDGVPSITQCPIGPNNTVTYVWRATQHGTAWYHSHFGVQAWNEVFGGFVINGPATQDYDEDRGVLFLSDCAHTPTEDLYSVAENAGPIFLANGLLNGTNTWNTSFDSAVCTDPYSCPNPQTTPFKRQSTENKTNHIVGERFHMEVDYGKSYRLRLVNAAIDMNFRFLIEGHNFTVIAMDTMPIKPYGAHNISIMMGEYLLFDPPNIEYDLTFRTRPAL